MEEKEKNLPEERDPESMSSKTTDEDDGRIVADMSMLDDAFPRRFKRKKSPDVSKNTEEKDNDDLLNKEEKKWYILGALKASMIIYLAFAVGFAIVILLIILIYNLFN